MNRMWPSNPVNRRYRYLDRDLDQPGPVEQPAGAFLMIRRDVWERLGGIDEAFIRYGLRMWISAAAPSPRAIKSNMYPQLRRGTWAGTPFSGFAADCRAMLLVC